MSLHLHSLILMFMIPMVLYGEVAHHHHCRPDGNAPIGVMGDHLHPKGEWMVSYRFMDMSMEDNFQGSNKLSVAEARAMGPTGSYMMVPVEMSMRMQMLGVMYAPTGRNTLMLMFNHLDQEMEVEMMNGTRFQTASRGVGDSSLTWLIGLRDHRSFSWHFGAGFHMPTGSIGAKDRTPMSGGQEIQLPYSMQLGSGTWDLEPSLTILSKHGQGRWSGGGKIRGKFRTGKNRQGYALGDTFGAQLWTAWMWNHSMSSSLRLDYQNWGEVDGQDRDLSATPMMMPTADPSRRSGNRLDLGLGMNLLGSKGAWSGHRLALEWKGALRQDLDGPQLGVESSWTLGYQKAF